MIRMLSKRLRPAGKAPPVVRYGLTTVMVVMVTAAAWWLRPAVPAAPYVLFLPVVLAAAVVFDHGSSIYAIVLATLLSLYWLIDPVGSFAISRGSDVVTLAVVAVTGLVIATIVEAMRHAVEELSRANAELVHAHDALRNQGVLFDAVLEGTPDPIYVKDTEGRFIHVNSASARVLGAPVTAVLGRRDRDFLPADVADVIEANDRAVFAGTMQNIEEHVPAAGDRTHVFLSLKFPWRDLSGRVQGLVGISRDITERKAAEDLVAAADAQKQLLLYDINHRIKNHLQSVLGMLSLAARRAETLEEARQALNTGAGRLMVLGRVYNRLEVGRSTSVVDARGFIEELCNDLRTSLIGDRPLALQVDAAPAAIESDRAVTLGLAINEAVQNALKYAFPGERGGQVRVTFRTEGGEHELTIADNGVGFDTARAVDGGSGQRLLRAMAQQLGGQLVVTGDGGGRVVLRFPALAEGARG